MFIFFYLFIFSFWRNLQYHKLTYNLAEYKVLPYFRSEFEKIKKKGPRNLRLKIYVTKYLDIDQIL